MKSKIYPQVELPPRIDYSERKPAVVNPPLSVEGRFMGIIISMIIWACIFVGVFVVLVDRFGAAHIGIVALIGAGVSLLASLPYWPERQ